MAVVWLQATAYFIYPKMKKILLFLVFLVALSACKKDKEEDPFFGKFHFTCDGYKSLNSFEGQVGGQPYCVSDSPIDSFQWFPAVGFQSTEPIAGLNSKQYYELYFRFIPRDLTQPFPFELEFSYKDPLFTGSTLEELIDQTFINGKDLPLSRLFSTLEPDIENVLGFTVALRPYFTPVEHFPFGYYTSGAIIQPSDSYVRCTKIEKTIFSPEEIGYKIEMQVKVMIPPHRENDGVPPPMKQLEGTFNFNIVF